MNGREIGNIACKILGIFFIVQGTNTLASIISFTASTPGLNGYQSLLNICFALIYIICGILLCSFFSSWTLLYREFIT
ncbi:hypothetical protein Desde_0867 [Desulfitobacterium dehalogenans ATCC 51507]|uniref:Uncharacterized protein n=1 Tax=Desulfitobacterium dehalogenans (strain ATCC 51507 / DSM 9161 / JW/IU-DC1) TaxID=756499 RepID=I4A5S3_DESDJ|nr:hypothetical protein Desde_0867 [Desulfitobacterium dehalogenans ATCC 51507]